MTSANLSLVDRLKNHRKYLNRTLWTGYIGLTFLAAYFILGVIMMVSRTINYAMRYNQPEAILYQEKLRAVSRIMGMEQIGFLLVIGIAVMFALQGFSYVFNTSQLDFYLSQPTTKVQRVAKNYFNAISTFLIMYVGCEIVALIIAACMGASGKYLYLSVLVETVRALNLFLAFYNITVLAIMLSGSMPIAVLLTICFSVISVLFSEEIRNFKGIFFATYSDLQPFRAPFSPLYDRFGVYIDLVTDLRDDAAITTPVYIQNALTKIMPRELDILITSIIAFAFVIIFARMRQAEWAGKSIVIRPFRWLMKIVVCVVTALGVGIIVYQIYEGVWTNRLFTQMCVIMVIATIITGCIAEVILEGNIRRVFKGVAQTVMALAIVLLIFVIFRGDLLGFDSYVPATAKVESCAIMNYDRQFHEAGYGVYNGMSDEDTMFITNVEDFVTIAAAGMENRKVEAKNNEEGNYMSLGYDLTILYRLKSGKKVYRYVCVPFDVCDQELGRIINSNEFKEGYFDVFNDDNIREIDAISQDHTLTYESNLEANSTKTFDFTKLSDVYRKDILESYSFEYMKEHRPIGTITYDSNGMDFIYGNLDVFENYTNTIAYLKELGIYSESKLSVEDIAEAEVWNYYPGYDLEITPYSEINIDGLESRTMTYVDEESIKEILENCVESSNYNPWYNYDKLDEQYSVTLTRKGDRNGYPSVYCSFLKGQVPEFVKEDTN